jgi:hypothetical protein
MRHHALSLTLTLAFVSSTLSGYLLAADPTVPAPGSAPGMGAGPGMGMGRGAPAFSDFDLNGDGSLTEAEFNEARANRMSERATQGYPMRNAGNAPAFGSLDTDGNGKVTPDEFAAGQAQHRQQTMTTP